jgi:hypothetical protein
MLFNKVDRNHIEKLIEPKIRHLQCKITRIIDQFVLEDFNDAKKILMVGVNLINESRIFHKALYATFRKGTKDVRKSRIIVEKYMNQFRRELNDGCIEPYVDRNEVMRIF